VAITFYTKEDIPYVKNIANIIAASEKQAGKPPSEASVQKWLLDALPKPSKEEKKKLKKYGVKARRGGLGQGKEGKEAKGAKGRMQISTKSGYERKLEIIARVLFKEVRDERMPKQKIQMFRKIVSGVESMISLL